MTNDFNWTAFHRRRRIFKLAGLVAVFVGLFLLADFLGEVPTPFRGARAIIAGLAVIVFGLIALYKGYKLPVEEALDLIHAKNRGITESEVVHDMRVDRLTARRIIDALVGKGFLRRASEQTSATEEVFEPVR